MHFDLSRRQFLTRSAVSALSVSGAGAVFSCAVLPVSASSAFSAESTAESAAESILLQRAAFGMNGTNAQFFIPGLSTDSRILHVTDTHLFLDDERGKDFVQYSARMATAYHQTAHYMTGTPTGPMESLEAALRFAREKKVDAVALTGDILSFPSEAAADWLLERLEKLKVDGIPYFFTSGNHDWHYEGWPGSDAAKREEWIPKRLGKLYPETADPLAYSVCVKGVRHLFIDDSIYEILPVQLDFLKKELAFGDPTVVWMHIPPYAPGRGIGFGCGHPKWGAETDRNWKIERRERWREGGHTQVSFDFYRLLCESPNLLGTFCGHVHATTLDIVNGKPFIATEANARGAWRLVEFRPMAK